MDLSERPPSGLTVAIGLSGFAAFVGGVSLAGGIYGSSTGEFGLFLTGGFMIGIVSGAGGGPELVFVFGTPSDFRGVFVTVNRPILRKARWEAK